MHLSRQLGNFTNTTPGLDMALRLIQAVAQIAEVCLDPVIAVKCMIAKNQLALGRRYLRFLSSFGCFQRVFDLSAEEGTIQTLLEITQFTGLGLYLFLEDLTMLHDMNIWLVDWYIPVLMEGNKFWFYAICISIARTLAEFWMGESKRKKTESKLLLERLLVDLCDLTLPGSFLGWIPLGDFGVGVAMVVSTIVASREMWVRAGWVG